MAENTRRGLFTLSGITGMLIATVLLLSILVGLTIWSVQVQQAQSTNYYDPSPIVGSLDNIKSDNKENAKFAFQPAK